MPTLWEGDFRATSTEYVPLVSVTKPRCVAAMCWAEETPTTTGSSG